MHSEHEIPCVWLGQTTSLAFLPLILITPDSKSSSTTVVAGHPELTAFMTSSFESHEAFTQRDFSAFIFLESSLSQAWVYVHPLRSGLSECAFSTESI